MQHHDISIEFGQNHVHFKFPFSKQNCFFKPPLISEIGQKLHLPITSISAARFHRMAKLKDSQVFTVSVLEINSILEQSEGNSSAGIPVAGIPAVYSKYYSMFEENMAKHLPPHRVMDLKIELKEGAQAPFGPLYNMSMDELKVLKGYISENLDRGLICVSSSSAASPVLFVKKNDGSLRLCVDYRALNSVTRKDRYPLPPIWETLNRLASAKW